jgi:hypothetical protein
VVVVAAGGREQRARVAADGYVEAERPDPEGLGDGSTPMGRFAIGILTLIAELELERITENWETAVSEAVKRGVHISARVPTGYRKRGKSMGLEPVEPAASVVPEVFRRRAVGASYSDLARFLEQKGVLPSTGNPYWSPGGVASLLRNRVYLGEARSGKVVNPTARQPLVTQAEFDAARTAHSVLPTPQLSLSSEALLKGLARCAGWGTRSRSQATSTGRSVDGSPITTATGDMPRAPARRAPRSRPPSSTRM